MHDLSNLLRASFGIVIPKLIEPAILMLPILMLTGGNHRLIPDGVFDQIPFDTIVKLLLLVFALLILLRQYLTRQKRSPSDALASDDNKARPNQSRLQKQLSLTKANALAHSLLSLAFFAVAALFGSGGSALTLGALIIYLSLVPFLYSKHKVRLDEVAVMDELSIWKKRKAFLKALGQIQPVVGRVIQIFEDIILFTLLCLLLSNLALPTSNIGERILFFLVFRYFCRFTFQLVASVVSLLLVRRALDLE